MITLSYWDTIGRNKGSRLPINVNGFRAISLSMDLNQAYILDIEINPAMNDLYCDIADNPFAGILLESEDCQIAFIKSNEREERYVNGRQVIRLYSSVWELTRCSLQYQQGVLSEPSLKSYISGIDPNFNFVFISDDQEANIDTGIPANSFELLREVCINNGWSFRENGVDENGDTIILVGDFRDIKNFGTGRKYEPLEIRYDPENEFPPTKWSDDIVYLEDFRATYNRNYTTHMFVYASQFSGLNTESITEFSSNNFDFVDQDFPIVRLPDNKWYVQNTQAYNQIDKVKYLTKRLQYQQETSVDLIDGTEYDESLTLEQMYKYAVAQLRRDYERVSYALDVRYLELVLPGSCMNLEIGHWVKDYNGWTKQVFDVNDTRLARNIQYNEQELAALIT